MNLFRRVVQLFVGLVLYGVSTALMVESGLGLNPWDVFHQGLSEVTGISFGVVVLLVGVPVLLLWIPLRQRPGFGTVANLVVVGFAADAALRLLPAGESLPAKVGLLVGGILLNGFATGLYIGSRMGPGPRDGLMTGLAGRFPTVSLRVIRTGIELLVLGAGFLLGGTVGVGTIAYAVAIGPLVHLFLPRLTVPDRSRIDLPDTFASR
ncbi:YczE/YyaS/YitT family protein [Actinoplanes sp. G11-F43]|uniref:membrane protein YczE n=1 Tax=Actinoplanes sp. G11-F43 TaxID=3424130 RepID=UPI003D3267E5